MIDIEERKLFYETNYDLIANYNCSAHTKLFVDAEKMKPYTCRFCGRTAPDVSFKKVAHAVSELVGNKALYLKSECDACNELFG